MSQKSNREILCSNFSKENILRKQREEVKGKGREWKEDEKGRAEEAVQSERRGSYMAPLVLG